MPGFDSSHPPTPRPSGNGVGVDGRNGANGHHGSSHALITRRPRDLTYSHAADADYADAANKPAINLLAVTWRQRWIVVACCVVALAVGFVYLARATPIYASSSVINVRTVQPKLAADVMGNARTSGFIFTQCQILTSTAIVQSALAKPQIAGLETLAQTPNPVGRIKSIVRAEPDKQGELIAVTAESPNAADNAQIVNALVESYVGYVTAQHKSSAVELLKSLQQQYDASQRSLNDNSTAMLRLKQENPELITTADRALSPTVARFNSVGEELTAAQLRQVDLNTARQQALAVREDPYRLKRVLDQFKVTTDAVPAIDPTLTADYRQLRNTVEELTAKMGPQHASVKEAQRRLARAEADLADATRASVAGLMALLDQAIASNDARVTALQGVASTDRKGTSELNRRQFEYELLVQRSENLERQLDTLDARMKDITIAEDVGAMSVDVLESAEPGGLPVRPIRGKTLGMALMMGLMAGLGLGLLRDTLDHRLRSVDEILGALDVPVLGTIPHIGGRGTSVGRRVTPAERARCVQVMPRSAAAEAFRTLRTAVYYAMPEASAGKTILVTSPAPGDGKSTTASNVAIAVAQAGRRVLLIDADCRRPTLARLYGVEHAPGLASVLMGSTTMAAAVRATSVDGLSILPAGDVPSTPAELLDSVAFRTLLANAAEQYDQVIIDSPPIVPVTDARIIAAVADATLLVLRAERSTRRLASLAREALGTVGARLVGVVVSDVPRGSKRYGYYGGGRYGYTSVHVDVGASANGRTHSTDGASPVSKRERVAGELVGDAHAPRE